MARQLALGGVLAALLFSLLAASATAQEASGFFRFKDERGEYTHGVAIRWADPDAPGKFKLGVLLSDAKPDIAAASGQMEPLDAIASALPDSASSLRLSLDEEDGKLGIGHVFVRPGGFNTSGDGDEKISLAGGRLKGSWKFAPKSFFDDTYEADFSFDVALVDIKDPGTPLPAGGGEPGKAYAAYIAALAKGDIEGVKKALGEGGGWRFSWVEDDNAKARALEDEALHKPVKVTISGGWVDGDRAQLKVEGPGRFGGNFKGRVMMQREDGAWKVAEQNLQ